MKKWVGELAVQNIWYLYKKTVCRSLAISGFLFITGLVLGWEWFSVGIPKDSGTVYVGNLARSRDSPVIETQNKRVLQGEKIRVEDLASARDIDGKDIGETLIYQDENGQHLRDDFDTGTPGEYHITVSVKSRISGCENSRRIVVLVDGRVGS